MTPLHELRQKVFVLRNNLVQEGTIQKIVSGEEVVTPTPTNGQRKRSWVVYSIKMKSSPGASMAEGIFEFSHEFVFATKKALLESL